MNEELKAWAEKEHQRAIHNFNTLAPDGVPESYSQAFWNGYGVAMQALLGRKPLRCQVTTQKFRLGPVFSGRS